MNLKWNQEKEWERDREREGERERESARVQGRRKEREEVEKVCFWEIFVLP